MDHDLMVGNTNLISSSVVMGEEEVQGIRAVTQSRLGQSVRGAVIGGAQLADSLDLQWERFSDGLRDEQKCDPRTNRRMFDNGTRRDGTKIGNPVLGALCTPEPLRPLDTTLTSLVQELAQESILRSSSKDELARSKLLQRQEQVAQRVGPAFARAEAKSFRDHVVIVFERGRKTKILQ